MPTDSEWRKWGRHNQESPNDFPLIPDSTLSESNTGLEKVIPTYIETSLPRLPWGSHKALIITLHSEHEPLEKLITERNQVQAVLSKAGFSVELIDADENDDPSNFRKQLAANHWDILHFIGHMTGEENHIGLSGSLSAADFVASCCRSAPPRLVVLNACRSGDMSAETDVAGISGPIAEQFCLRGVDAVIATRWDIWDQASANFSEKFWPYLVEPVSGFTKDIELQLDVELALLKTRNDIKSIHPERDACWLAYNLFTSREDGCKIPSQLVQAYSIDMGHPPFFELENHCVVCEYLAPGGAGLYLMAAPACTGKSTTAQLALSTLGILNQQMCFISLRHDDSMEIINTVHNALHKLDYAPFHPLVLDDAELLMNHVHSEIHEKLFEISKRVPLLLITRERQEHLNQFHILPFLKLNPNPDELMRLRPHIPTPEELQIYLSANGFDVDINKTELLLNRMQMRLFTLPAFFDAARKGNIDFDILDYPLDAALQNRLESITDDEMLALQIIAKSVTPLISKHRAMLAWMLLQQKELVRYPPSIFSTLDLLGIAQDYFSPEYLPKPSEINDEFLARVPEDFKQSLPEEYREFLYDILGPNQPWDQLESYPPWLFELYRGYTVNNDVIASVKEWPDHPHLALARRACIGAAEGLGDMPRLKDGYDEPEMMLQAMQPLPNEGSILTPESLKNELYAGANSRDETLDHAMEKWFASPSEFKEAILGNKIEIYVMMAERIPNLRFETILSLGEFVIDNQDVFPLEVKQSADFLWFLIETARSKHSVSFKERHTKFWAREEWTEIIDKAEFELNKYPVYVDKMQVRKAKMRAHFLLYNIKHKPREEMLLLVAKEALMINGEDALEMYLLHLDYCQILYRHFLFQGSRPILDAFQAHIDASEEIISADEEPDSLLKFRLERGMNTQRIWMHVSLALIKQRLELNKDNNATIELRWVRDLIEAGHRLGEVCTELRKAVITEAASRLLRFKYRKKLQWDDEQYRIRARLTRDIRERVYKDRNPGEKLHISSEFHPHLIYSFDRHNTLPPILRGQMPPPPPTSETERKWHEAMSKIIEKIDSLPDPPVDLSWILKKRSASIIEMDQHLGPLTVDATCRVAAILWKETMHLGAAACNVGAFASTYFEMLTPDEKTAADEFRF